MDDSTLQSLRTALAVSPDNADLLAVVTRALVARAEVPEALALLDGRDLGALPAGSARQAAAEAFLAAEDAARALSVLGDDEAPESLILKAKAHHRLGDQKEAASAYREAVAQNPILEDLELKAHLAAFTSKKVGPEAAGPRLAVISNDDTDQSEMNRLLHPEEERITFERVGGHDDIKAQIHKRIILPFQKPSLFERFKKRVGGGILLYGPPGCGKTLLARATAGECSAQFFNVAINDILDMYIGESERKLHAIFDQARQKPPSVLFFDELEALAGKRQYTREATSSKLVSQFLAEMDGFSRNNQGVLILGATNVPWAIDPAFRRPGRFDRVLFVPPPDKMARAAILDLLLADRPCEDGLDCTEVAKLCSGFSGADLQNLVETAADHAIADSLEAGRERPIRLEHLRLALKEVKPTTSEWLTTARNYARYANEGGQYDEVLSFLKAHGKS